MNKDCRVLFGDIFIVPFLGSSLGMDSNVQPGVAKFVCNWPEWFARVQRIWRQIFEKCQMIGALGPVHTNAFSDCIDRFTSTLPFWCVYDCPHRKTFEDDRIARCDVSRRKLNSLRMLQTHAFAIFQVIFPVIVFILMRFQPSSTVHIDMMYNRFRFHPLSRAFSNRWVFDENAQRISVDGRRKRAEMYAFSSENELVWKEP